MFAESHNRIVFEVLAASYLLAVDENNGRLIKRSDGVTSSQISDAAVTWFDGGGYQT